MSLDRIFLALDGMNRDEITTHLNLYRDEVPNLKIGMELFYKYGPEIVVSLKEKYKSQIFLDLKLHDIPKTVSNAFHSIKELPIDFLTVHLSGGEEMLTTLMNNIQKANSSLKILGVSFLTSLESKDTQQIFGLELSNQHFEKLFQLASQTNIAGVICSPHEVHLAKKINPQLITVTPGLRFRDEIQHQQNIGDQKRIFPIEDAPKLNADYLVIGRSLTMIKKEDELFKRIKIIKELDYPKN